MINPFLDRKKKLRNGWWVLLFFVMLGGLLVPAQLLASRHAQPLGVGWQALMVLVVTLACTALRREPPSSALGTVGTWRKGAVLGVVLGAALWLVTAALLVATGSVRWGLNPAGPSVLLAGVLACGATAFAEELVFRGFIFQRLLAGLGLWPAQVLMAAYFVLNHANNPGMTGGTRAIAMVNIFVASLLFGAAYVRTRSLALPTALHFGLNFTQGALLGFGVSGNQTQGLLVPHITGPAWWTGGAFGLEASVPGTLVVASATLAMILRKSRAESTWPGVPATE